MSMVFKRERLLNLSLIPPLHDVVIDLLVLSFEFRYFSLHGVQAPVKKSFSILVDLLRMDIDVSTCSIKLDVDVLQKLIFLAWSDVLPKLSESLFALGHVGED